MRPGSGLVRPNRPVTLEYSCWPGTAPTPFRNRLESWRGAGNRKNRKWRRCATSPWAAGRCSAPLGIAASPNSAGPGTRARTGGPWRTHRQRIRAQPGNSASITGCAPDRPRWSTGRRLRFRPARALGQVGLGAFTVKAAQVILKAGALAGARAAGKSPAAL